MTYNRNNESSYQNRQKSPTKRFLSVLGLFMFGFYFVLGLVIIFWKNMPLEMDKNLRIMFGALLIIYSFFRFVRLWQNR